VGVGATGTRGTPGAALHREVGAGVAGPRGAPGAALRREVGARAAGPRGTPGATLRWEVDARAAGTRGTPGATLSREVGTRAMGTCGTLRAALSWEVGAGATGTRGSPRASLSWELGTTPPPPPLRPSACGQGMVVPVTPPDNSRRMITRGMTGFKVVPDHLVLITATSSPMLSSIPSSAHAALADPHWCADMEDEYEALISNGTWELVP
jgi:hypothetical protein